MRTPFCLLLSALLGGGPASAAVYHLSDYSCSGESHVHVQGPEPGTFSGGYDDCLDAFLSCEVAGHVGRGSLGTRARGIDQNPAADHLGSGLGGMAAAMTFGDVIFEGPGLTVDVALRLHLQAFLSAESAEGFTTAGVTLEVQLSGYDFLGAALLEVLGGAAEMTAGELLEGLVTPVPGGYAVDAVVVTPTMEVATNSTLNLVISLRSDAAAHNPHGVAEALADAGNTLSFPLLEPVFDLPAGYTAHSVEAGITDNLWAGNVAAEGRTWGSLKARY